MTDFSAILTEASRLRLGMPCALAGETPCLGGSHRVFKIVFQDSVQWAARVSNDLNDWDFELRAAKQFQYIKQQCPEIKAPKIYIKEEHPIVYSEWVTGEPLATWNSRIPLTERQRILDDLAEFLLQLWTVPAPSAFAQNRTCLYSTWLTESLDRGLRRTLRGTARWGNAIDYLIMRSMIPSYAAKHDRYASLGFAHGDLNAHNIMKSDNFHLTGVIDWDWLSVAPLPAIVHHPWFIADIPGWKNDGVSEGEEFTIDRRFLEASIRNKERSTHLLPTISTLLSDSGKRLFFQSAFHYKAIHKEFVRMYCPWTEENFGAARSQLDTVLSSYPELRGDQGVQEVKDRLWNSGEQRLQDA